jgi:guanylate kinase
MSTRRGQRGHFIVLSSPSGGGKSTIIQRLLAQIPNLLHSISVTTRNPRGSEKNGDPYWFISREEFLRQRDAGELLEWEEVYGDYYGTPRQAAEAAAAAGHQVIFDLDVKGALRLKAMRPETLLIFLYPPSFDVLERRLRQRGTETEERLQNRLAVARWECEQAGRFDHVVVNDDLEKAVAAVQLLIRNFLREANRS